MDISSSTYILIVGSNGFLGLKCAERFSRYTKHIHGLGRSDLKSEFFEKWITSDLNSTSLVIDLSPYDFIVNCAASSSVSLVKEDPSKAYCDTVLTIQSLLRHYRVSSSHAKIIHCSSAAVYGESKEMPICIDFPLNPISTYGTYKAISEMLLQDFSRSYGISYSIIRFFSIYGPPLRKQLLWDAARKFSESTSSIVTFFGTGFETRDWIYVSDAVSLIELMFKTDVSVVNGGSGASATIFDTLFLLKKSIGADKEIRFSSTVKPGDPLHYLADINNLLELGWAPTVTLSQGISHYSEWFLRQ